MEHAPTDTATEDELRRSLLMLTGRAGAERCRQVLRHYLALHGYQRHNFEAYDNFVLNVLPRIVRENSTVTAESRNSADVKRRVKLEFGETTIGETTHRESDGTLTNITPREARERRLTYSVSVFVDVTQLTYEAKNDPANPLATAAEWSLLGVEHVKGVLLFECPVMVRSAVCHLRRVDPTHGGDCPHDRGGYFIVNGIEKCLMPQEKMRTNYAFVRALVATAGRHSHACELRSWHESKMRSTSTLHMYITARGAARTSSAAQVVLRVPFLEVDVPLHATFRVLGVDAVDDMVELTLGAGGREASPIALRELARTVCGGREFEAMTRADVVDWLGRHGSSNNTAEKRATNVAHIFTSEFLPHVGLDASPATSRRKAIYLGWAVRKLLRVYLGDAEPDDRDSVANKYADTAGVLLAMAFRQQFRAMLRNLGILLRKALDKNRFFNVSDLVNDRAITGKIRYCLATGNWGIQNGGGGQVGVAQLLTRTNVHAAVSHTRRVNTPINRDGKQPRPRQVHVSQFGVLCPAETPEGASCGLHKNLALLAHVRVGCDSALVLFALRDVLAEEDARLFRPLDPWRPPRADDTVVLVNGAIEGTTDAPEALVARLRTKRRVMDLPFDTGVVHHVADRVVSLNTFAGAYVRPLLRVDALHRFGATYAALDHAGTSGAAVQNLWTALQLAGVVEYVDKEEEAAHCVVATDAADVLADRAPGGPRRFTHVEVAPWAFLGVCASQVPFSDRDQSPRVIYETGMMKQSIGVPSTTFQQRNDSLTHALWYPQKPLVRTDAADVLDLSDGTPTGVNLVIAILCHTGYNQEDSCLFSRDAIERGVGRLTLFRTVRDEEKGSGTGGERFERPPPDCVGLKSGDFSKLADGEDVVDVGAVVVKGDVLVAKTMPVGHDDQHHRARGGERKRDVSLLAANAHPARVHRVTFTDNKDNTRSVSVTTRQVKKPEVGDKFCMTGDHEVYALVPADAARPAWVSLARLALAVEAGVATRVWAMRAPGEPGFAAVERVHRFAHAGEMFRASGPDVDLLVTGEHRMYARPEDERGVYRFELARDLHASRAPHTYLGGLSSRTSFHTDPCVLERVPPPADGAPFDVFCPEVPPLGLFYARRNGRAVWTGNSSHHGQKGVIGAIYPAIDMPFTADGVTPDIVMNSNAIPSRMTIGQLFETLLGKVACAEGLVQDGTPFNGLTIEQLGERLRAHGMEPMGHQRMYCGTTGEPIESPVFIGVLHMQRLTHMVEGKTHSRTNGKKQMLTRQPVDGRTRDGGMRVGEMERDAMISHGSAFALMNMFVEQSDAFLVKVCRTCGHIAETTRAQSASVVALGVEVDPERDGGEARTDYCRYCDSHDNIESKGVPYPFKLLAQELQAMHIDVRIRLSRPEDPPSVVVEPDRPTTTASHAGRR